MNINQESTLAANKLQINNRMMKYMLYKLSRMKTQLIMFTVFSFLSYPLLAIAVGDHFKRRESFSASSTFFAFSVFICAVSLLVIVILMNNAVSSNFKYYHSKTAVDMNYSLPITNGERFWGDFISGLVPFLLINIVSIVTALIILYANLGDMDYICNWAFGLMLIALIVLISFYAISVFSATLSGRSLESNIIAFFVLIFLPAAVILTATIPFLNVDQMDANDLLMYSSAGISPIMFVISIIFTADKLNFVGNFFELLSIRDVLPIIIFIAVLIAASYFLGTRRKTERVGNAFAFKFVSNTLLGLLIYSIISVFILTIQTDRYSDAAPYIITMLILSFIGFLIFEVLTKRSFKKFHFALVKYIGMVGASVILALLLLNSRGFGIGEYVPKVSDIESISFYNRYTFDEPENIELIHDIHLISNEKYANKLGDIYSMDSSTNPDNVSGMFINYKLKNGSTVKRRMFYTDEQWKMLEASDEYKTNIVDEFKRTFASYDKRYNTKDMIATKKFAVYGKFNQLYGISAQIDFDTVLEAYKKDLLAESYEQRDESTDPNIYTLEYQVSYDRVNYGGNSTSRKLPVKSHYENTIAYIRQFIDLDTELEINYDKLEVVLWYRDSYGSGSGVSVPNISGNPDYIELIENSVYGDTFKDVFYLMINYENYKIPPEYQDLAASVFVKLHPQE